ncbi:MAG TPA: hypothetical protein VLC48_11705 [Gemmatimonadota bacterium]|nr:hypothetical protein [Gemmatimonadota bacterium]
MKRFTLFATLLAALTIVAAACSDDPTSPRALAGLYALIDVDDVAVPATTDSTANSVTRVTQGALNVDPNGTYTLVVAWQTTPTGGAPATDAYSQTGDLVVTGENAIRLEGDDDDDWIGVVEGNALRIAVLVTGISATSVELRYRK